jgi:hypothetical protein
MAEKIENIFICQENNNQFNNKYKEKYELWIKYFFIEFIKKWTKIDFLRLDKYIMLTETIIKKYFEINILNQNLSHVLKIFHFILDCINAGYYNYSFLSIILKLYSFFIGELFVDNQQTNNNKLLQNHYKNFLDTHFQTFINELFKLFKYF